MIELSEDMGRTLVSAVMRAASLVNCMVTRSELVVLRLFEGWIWDIKPLMPDARLLYAEVLHDSPVLAVFSH